MIGVVYDPVTLTIHQVIVPDDDATLDDPAWTNGGALSMLRLSPGTYYGAQSREGGLAAVIAQAQAQIGGG